MQTEHFYQIMNDKTEIAVNRWIPEDEENIKAIVVLSHGMLEHSLRYDRVGSIFAENGFILQAHDHRGHGKTAFNAVQKKTGMFGKLADKNGFEKVVSDLDEVIDEVHKDYPGKKIILLGHSFGSIVSQRYIELHGEKLAACILSGTTGPKKIAKVGNLFCSFMSIFGSSRRSEFLQDKIAFGGYLSRIENPSSKHAWLSKSEANLQMYENDEWCGGTATVSFIKDITHGLVVSHKPEEMKRIPKNLPIYFIAGTEDPVGEYTASIKKLAAIYRENGIASITENYIPGERHEIFNEDDGDKNVQTVIQWIEEKIK